MVSFPQVSPPETCAHLSPAPYAPHAPPISFFSILPPAQYSVGSTDEYRPLSSSLCNFLHSPVTSSHLANSLDTAVSEPALYRLLTFHVPKTMSLFRFLLRGTSSRNTPPTPRRSEWWSSLPPDCFVSRGSISLCEYYLTWVFTGRRQHLAQTPSWRTTPFRLPATAYSIYSQLPSISEAVPPSAT